MKSKLAFGSIILGLLLVLGGFLYFRYMFTYEQRNLLKRKVESITGQNLTVTVFSMDGKIVKRWTGVQKITAGQSKSGTGERNYTFFYTKDNKYVQIPDSVWYVAEEE